MTFSVQQIDKKWSKKKVSKGSSTWFFSKNGHFWTNAYVEDPQKNPKNEKCQKNFLQYREILVENAFLEKRDQKNFFGGILVLKFDIIFFLEKLDQKIIFWEFLSKKKSRYWRKKNPIGNCPPYITYTRSRTFLFPIGFQKNFL